MLHTDINALRFEPSERLAVWSWDGAHRLLVSLIEATPLDVEIEYPFAGGTRHARKRVSYAVLFERSDGSPVTWSGLQP